MLRSTRILEDFLGSPAEYEELNLHDKDVNDEIAEIIADSLSRAVNLKNLRLSRNNIGDRGATVIANSLIKNSLPIQELDFEDNLIGPKGARDLSIAIEHSKNLTYLNLCDNRIGDDGAEHLSRALLINTTLTDLDLKCNQIGNIGGEFILESLEQNTTLKTLDIEDDNLSSEIMSKIKDLMSDAPSHDPRKAVCADLHPYSAEITDGDLSSDVVEHVGEAAAEPESE